MLQTHTVNRYIGGLKQIEMEIEIIEIEIETNRV